MIKGNKVYNIFSVVFAITIGYEILLVLLCNLGSGRIGGFISFISFIIWAVVYMGVVKYGVSMCFPLWIIIFAIYGYIVTKKEEVLLVEIEELYQDEKEDFFEPDKKDVGFGIVVKKMLPAFILNCILLAALIYVDYIIKAKYMRFF